MTNPDRRNPSQGRFAAVMAVVLAVHAAVAFPADPGTDAATDEPRHPHIVVILADDLGFGDVRVNNPHSRIPTPYLDRLAAEGRNFTDFHTTSAVCTPTRYSLITGRYNWRTRLKSRVTYGWTHPLIPDDRVTVADVLRDAGYFTAVVGKWHLGLAWVNRDDIENLAITRGPNTLGFDYSLIHPGSTDTPPYCFVRNFEVVDPPTDHIEQGVFGHAGARAPGLMPADVMPIITGDAVRVIHEHAAQRADQPLFLYFSLTSPHVPVAPAEPFIGGTDVGAYGDFVLQTDWTVGQIMHALDEAGMAEDTLLIFTSDNGAAPDAAASAIALGHMPNWPWRSGKTTLWEGGHRVPMLVRWPGRVSPGTTTDALVSIVDFMATFADVVGTRLPYHVGEDSVSMLPLLGETAEHVGVRETAVFHSSQGRFAIRKGPWKLITIPGGGGWDNRDFGTPRPPIDPDTPMQLYHLIDDPQEVRNLYREQPDVVRALLDELIEQINLGRSTPGVPQPNDTGWWEELGDFMTEDHYTNDRIMAGCCSPPTRMSHLTEASPDHAE
jgi:arylsulfatase A